MNIVFEPAPAGTTHFLRYASGYVVWCKVEAGQNHQLILSEWDGGNEYWVPGIHPVEFYQQTMGLASIGDLPTKTEMPIPESAPKGATHCYQHGGETSWYRETEDNLFVWRDGSWYASTQKSARDLAKVCPLGAVIAIGGDAHKPGEVDHLTWLARNVHEWPAGEHQDWCYVGHGYHDLVLVAMAGQTGMAATDRERITRQQWLTRRAELQNKPSWEDHPDAKCFVQDGYGNWLKNTLTGDAEPVSESWWATTSDGFAFICVGEVLGDWRDTLERRPVDLSEPAGGVKERGADGAEEPNAIAQRLLTALKNDPRAFDTGALVEMVELADAEIVKRDAAVCGGDGCINNHWFERGELPSAGVECEVRIGEGWRRTRVVATLDSDVGKLPIFTTPWSPQHYVGCGPEQFRPIRTEHDRLMSILSEFDGSPGSAGRIADAILTDGFKRDGGVK